jgi:hypothetical protein
MNLWSLTLTVFLLLPAPFAASAAATPADCPDNNLPYAINFGLPRLPGSPALQPDNLTRDIEKLFRDFYAEHGRCRVRQLQINITVANEYQILDWLGRDMQSGRRWCSPAKESPSEVWRTDSRGGMRGTLKELQSRGKEGP